MQKQDVHVTSSLFGTHKYCKELVNLPAVLKPSLLLFIIVNGQENISGVEIISESSIIHIVLCTLVVCPKNLVNPVQSWINSKHWTQCSSVSERLIFDPTESRKMLHGNGDTHYGEVFPPCWLGNQTLYNQAMYFLNYKFSLHKFDLIISTAGIF